MAGQYQVKAGDSWARIAGDAYGNQRWLVELAKANGGTGRVLHPGDVIDLPDFDTGVNPTISQGDWNDITGANNFGGGGGGGYSGRPPTPQIGSPTQPRPTSATTAPPTPIVRPFTSVGSQRRQDELPPTRPAVNRVATGSTRQGNINTQRQQALASNQRGANLNAMAARYGKPAGSTVTANPASPDYWRTLSGIYSGRQGLPAIRSLTPSPGSVSPAMALDYTRSAMGINTTPVPTRNPNYNPANNRANTRVQTVADNRTVSYGTEGSPLTQAQFNRGAQYTGEAFQHYITSPEHDRKKLPRFMTTDLARVMPFPKRAGVTTEDWLRGMGYEEFRPGVWRIMEPVSKYATGGRGRYSGGGGGTYTEGGGGGGRRGGGGGGGGGGYYNQASNLGLVNWRIGIG